MKNKTSSPHIFSLIETLEQRIAPAVLVGTAGGKLTIKGDNSGDTIVIDAVVGQPKNFTITSGAAVSHATGVTEIAITLGSGNDTLTFSNNVAAIDIAGGLTIKGGAGEKNITGTDVTVGKNVSITLGSAGLMAGHTVGFVNPAIGGSFSLHEGSGATSYTYLERNSAGNSTVHGGVTIINGAGSNDIELKDMNVGGNVKVINGPTATGSNADDAGETYIYNDYNTSALSVIKGSVLISNQIGSNSDGIWDTEVLGSVTMKRGSGTSTTYLDGYTTGLKDIIHGNLSITGTGATSVRVGAENEYTGLSLGGNLKIASGTGGDSLVFNGMNVSGRTSITIAAGTNSLNIYSSSFAKSFAFQDAKGTDTINLAIQSGASSSTNFDSSVALVTGAGGASITLGGNDTNEVIYAYSTFNVLEKGGGQITNYDIVFPFGGNVHSS